MKYLLFTLILSLISSFCFGQDSDKNAIPDEDMIYIFVTGNGKVMLNGKKSELQRLELHLKDTDQKHAKIGTIKPTSMKAFAVYEKVVSLCEKYNIETTWYRDPEFTLPFFD